MARTKTQLPGDILPFAFPPPVGVRENPDLTAQVPDYADSLLNLLPIDGEAGTGLSGRPAFDRLNPGGTLDGPLTGAPQASGYFRSAAAEFPFVFAGGKLYKITWGYDLLGNPEATFTDVTPTGVTIHASAKIEWVMFNDLLIVTDGVNPPWKWDGAAAAATVLTDLSVGAYTVRSPAVYYAKLLFVKTGGPSTPGAPNRSLIWSEELDPDTGYENVLYNNFWNLALVDQDPLRAVRGTNEALVYWRESAMGLIQGQVSDNFTADATHDSISGDIGCGDSFRLTRIGSSFWFWDQTGRPQRFTLGTGFSEIWRHARRTLPGQQFGWNGFVEVGDGSSVSYDGPLQLVFFVFGPSSPAYVFHEPTGRFLGTWQPNGVSFTLTGLTLQPTGQDGVAFLRLTGGNTEVWRLAPFVEGGAAVDATTDDKTTGVSFTKRWVTPLAGFNDPRDKIWTTVAVILRNFGLTQTVTTRVRTNLHDWSSRNTLTFPTGPTTLPVRQVASPDDGTTGYEAHGRLVQIEVEQTNKQRQLVIEAAGLYADALAEEPELAGAAGDDGDDSGGGPPPPPPSEPEPMTLYFRNLVPTSAPGTDPPTPQPDGGDIKPHRALALGAGTQSSHFLDCTTQTNAPWSNLVEHSCSFLTEPLAASEMPEGTWEINTAFTREGLGSNLYELWTIEHLRNVGGTWQVVTTIGSGERHHGVGTNLGSITCGRQQFTGPAFSIQDGDLIQVRIGFRVSTIFAIGSGTVMRFSHDGEQELNADGVNSPTGPTAAAANIVTPDELLFL